MRAVRTNQLSTLSSPFISVFSRKVDCLLQAHAGWEKEFGLPPHILFGLAYCSYKSAHDQLRTAGTSTVSQTFSPIHEAETPSPVIENH
eukprot:1621767-Amphidinium_carterae.2